MAERAPWWRAFLVKKKSGGPKDTGVPGPDFDPFAPKPEKPKDPASASKAPSDQRLSQTQSGKVEPNKGTSLLSDETYDDSQMDSYFNEQTCRRNMRVSRSGRFKEKRRVRSTLPIEEETNTAASGKQDLR
ncbi:uncharacterized protein ACJ7VT_000650 isoform 1-T2 [Polymixia lowei]